MVHKSEYISTHPDLHTGMDAYSLDGEKLGSIDYLDEDSITIEKGWFFPKDFTIRYDDIVDIREDRIIVNRSREELEDWRSERYTGWEEYDRAEHEEEARIPVREEELDVEKHRREGEVRLHKVVHSEMKHLEVPVQKEEVIIERVPAEEARTSDVGGGEFREEETRIPVSEEEVEVKKRPVVKEEVRARKQTRTEQRDVSGEVRKEDVEIEHENLKRKR